MAASPGASCLSDPNFAVICAFLERFAKSCGITYPAFKELQEMLENVEEVPQELVDLHIKLLRKARKTVFIEKWEKALIKFCHTYSNQDGWELERFGYKKTRLEVKLRVLKMLLEGQFDLNSKFKASVNTLESEELRSKPLGKDKLGRVYWLQFDPIFNIRVYREDMDEESWTLVAQDRASLVVLLQELCENEYPLDLNLLNEDNINLQDETLDTGQNDTSTLEKVDLIEQNGNSSKTSQVEENIKDIPEAEKLIINDTLTQTNNVENLNVNHIQTENFSKIENSVIKENQSENILLSSEVNGDKSLSTEKPYEMEDLGDVIEEPVMYITGEGSGEDCMTGNPEKEDKSSEESQRLATDNTETQRMEDTSHCSSENIPAPKLNLEKIKPAPKLWSIDTICGVNSSKETEDKKSDESLENFDVKLKQKNFSSFSIDSVLEKKDLTGLSESKPFSQFSVESSNDTFPEQIQIKESDNSANKNNSDINNSVLCNSSSSMISYKNSKVLPCVMISKTENLIGKSQDSNTMINEMDSSSIVPPVDLRLESGEKNISLETLKSSEVNSSKNEEISGEGIPPTNIDGTKPFPGVDLLPSEKIPEKEIKGDKNSDLKDSATVETHDANENDMSNKNVARCEILNVIKCQKNYQDECKSKEEKLMEEKETFKNKPFSSSVEEEKHTSLVKVVEGRFEKRSINEKELLPISIESACTQKQDILECNINEPYNLENRLKNDDCLQNKTSDMEKNSTKNEIPKAMALTEKEFSKESIDEKVLQGKANSEETLKKSGEEENIENTSFKNKDREGDESHVKSQIFVPSDNLEISGPIEYENKLVNLSNTQLLSAEGNNHEKFEAKEKSQTDELEPVVELQANKIPQLNVNRSKENKKSVVEEEETLEIGNKVSELDENRNSEREEENKLEEIRSKKSEVSESIIPESADEKILEEITSKELEKDEEDKKLEEAASKESSLGKSRKSEIDKDKELEEVSSNELKAAKSQKLATDEEKKLEETISKETELDESEISENKEEKKLKETINKESKVEGSRKSRREEEKKLEEIASNVSERDDSKKSGADEEKKLEEAKTKQHSESNKYQELEATNKELETNEEKKLLVRKRELEADENITVKNESKKLEEETKKTESQEKQILSENLKSNKQNFEKFKVISQLSKGEKPLEEDLNLKKAAEDIKTRPKEKEEHISDSPSNKKEDENEILAGTNKVKEEKIESTFKSPEDIILSSFHEIPDQVEAKQFDLTFSKGETRSPQNEETKKMIKDFNKKEKKEECNLKAFKSTDPKFDENQDEVKLENVLKSSKKDCEKLSEINEKFEEKPGDNLKLTKVCDDTSKIKMKNSDSGKHNILDGERNFSVSKIELNEISESIKGEKHPLEADTKPNQMTSESDDLCTEESEISNKKLISDDISLNKHIAEVINTPELKGEDEKDNKLAETPEKIAEGSYGNITAEQTDEKSVDEPKEIAHKSGRKRKKGSLPARIMSRNRKTGAEDTTEEPESATPNKIKFEVDLKIGDEKLEKSNEIQISELEENVELIDKKEEGTENDNSTAEQQKPEIKKTAVTAVRRGRKARGRKRRKRIIAPVENKSAMEEAGKDKPKPTEDGSAKRKGRPKREEDNNKTGGRQITSREIKLLGITNPEAELTSVRQSRRIAQIKMREEAERRRLEALQLESFKSKKKTPKTGKKKSRKNNDSDSYDEKDGANEGDSEDEKSKQSKEKKSRKKKKKDKLVFNELNPWASSSGSSSVDEEEEEIEEEPHDDEELVFKSDHEFSPESDVEDPDYKPIKRARTAKVEESKEEPGKYDDTSCEKCNKNDHPEWILLCDKCDKGWHASCVRPALMVVPEGDWFCPPCEHASLIMKLQESLKQFDRCQRQRELEEMRKKRLAFVGISLDNVLPKKGTKGQGEDNENEEKQSNLESESGSEAESSESESGSGDSSEPVYQLRERRSNVTSYRYNEYDELIKSALQDEIEAVKGAGNAGRGKDINNIVNAEKQKQEKEAEEVDEENESVLPKTIAGDQENLTNVKLKEKVNKDDDDYEKNSDGEMVEEEEEDLVDEIPPVVPKDHSKKKKSKSLKITSLDFTSEEEDHNSDSDFKGASSEDESDYSLPSESESSDDHRKSRKNGPLRRSTRARTSRYDRDFINDDSDDSPKRKRVKREWDSSESSDSDRSWGRKKRKGNRSAFKSAGKHSRKKGKKSKGKRKTLDSDNEESLTPARPRNKKIKYGGLDSLDDQPVLTSRTRGKKINYQEMNGSDSEDEVKNPKGRPSRVIESDDDFIAENEKDEDAPEEESEEMESEIDEEEEEESGNDEEFSVKKNRNRTNEKIEKKGVISDSEESDKNDEKTHENELSKIVEGTESINKEKNIESILQTNIASNQDKFSTENEKLTQSVENKEERGVFEKGMSENKLQHFPYNEVLSDYPGNAGKFPKIGKIKITPSRAELASNLIGMPPLNSSAEVEKHGLTEDIVARGPSETAFESKEFVSQSSIIKSTEAVNPATNFLLRTLQSSQKPNSVEQNIPSNLSVNNSVIQSTRSPLPFPVNSSSATPLNMMALLNLQNQGVPGMEGTPPLGTPLSATSSAPQFSPFQGVISHPSAMNMLSSKIPTTVTGISEIESQNQSKKKGSKGKKKSETSLPSPENGSDIPATKDNAWPAQQAEEFSKMQGVQDSPPKKKGRGRGKKQLLAEAQAQALARTQEKQESQFLSQALPTEGGSVISRILNTSQNPSSFPRCELNQFGGAPRIRPPFGPNLPPNFPSPRSMAMRPRLPAVGGTIFHTSHPHDPSPSGGGAISIANSGLSKPSPPITSPFTRGGATLPIVPPRFPPDPNARPLFTSRNSPPRPEFSPFSHYFGNFPPPGSSLPNSENSNFSSSTFSESFGEDTQGSGSTSNPKQFDDETGGEFGGLASYFASQREDDLET